MPIETPPLTPDLKKALATGLAAQLEQAFAKEGLDVTIVADALDSLKEDTRRRLAHALMLSDARKKEQSA